ncbi:MAG: methyltransferase domain-containing protein [Wenzhouxiangellaceae bacterium]|nr:methyltransferase domain-containing protein [Wenzhouxiangellaceae bacterium]
MNQANYRAVWDSRSGDEAAALEAVDNSRSETVARATGAWTASQIRHALTIEPGDSVLELGCGAGRIGREIIPHCANWIGVDISPNMIRVAGRRLESFDGVRLEVLSGAKLSMIESSSVDKAYTVAVLCHMDKEDLFLYLREIARVLKPGGRAYLETWNLADLSGWQRWMYEVNFWDQADQAGRKDVARNQFCVPEELELYADRAGLDRLVCFRDSPWIQLIVGKDMDHEAVESERSRLARSRHEIAYSPLFGRLFLDSIGAIYGERHPADVLAEFDQYPPSPEVDLYKIYLRGMWAAEPERFGPMPESSGS